MQLRGTVVKESLEDESVLGTLAVTAVETLEVGNATPEQPGVWTLYSFEVAPGDALEVAKRLGRALKLGKWYAHFKNTEWVWVVFSDRVFYYRAGDQTGKEVATLHAQALGIPKSQLDW